MKKWEFENIVGKLTPAQLASFLTQVKPLLSEEEYKALFTITIFNRCFNNPDLYFHPRNIAAVAMHNQLNNNNGR